MNIPDITRQIEEEFSQFDNWLDKYNYLIEMGNDLPEMESEFKEKKYLISGCQSRVWLHAAMENGKVVLSADSDAMITKGIVALLVWVFSGQDPDDILNADMDFIDRIGLKEHLSPTRSNGLVSMIKQIKLYALAFKTRSMQGK